MYIKNLKNKEQFTLEVNELKKNYIYKGNNGDYYTPILFESKDINLILNIHSNIAFRPDYINSTRFRLVDYKLEIYEELASTNNL